MHYGIVSYVSILFSTFKQIMHILISTNKICWFIYDFIGQHNTGHETIAKSPESFPNQLR